MILGELKVIFTSFYKINALIKTKAGSTLNVMLAFKRRGIQVNKNKSMWEHEYLSTFQW